MTHLKM